MKQKGWLILLIIISYSCQGDKLEKIEDEALIKAILDNTLPPPEEVVFKNEKGQEISYEEFQKAQQEGDLFEDYYVDKEGNITEIIIREKKEQDEELLSKINKALEAKGDIKEVPDLPINCDDKANILQTAFEKDQNMRRSNAGIDPDIDKENLITIVNFIEKCGIPTLQQVNFEQMAGIWLVLQHAPPYYQKKYIPLFEQASEKGDINPAVVATMKDRALMYEGKPQIYGTQVEDGQLYNLLEPEYVDQRRAEMDMGPLAEYLQNFSIDFSVSQKRK
jgi:hypothetical protein